MTIYDIESQDQESRSEMGELVSADRVNSKPSPGRYSKLPQHSRCEEKKEDSVGSNESDD